MSHPIDELFRKGLNEAPLEGHEKDWVLARELLKLNKRKRRPVLVWVFLGVLAISAFVIRHYNHIEIDNSESLNNPKEIENNLGVTDISSDKLVESTSPFSPTSIMEDEEKDVHVNPESTTRRAVTAVTNYKTQSKSTDSNLENNNLVDGTNEGQIKDNLYGNRLTIGDRINESEVMMPKVVIAATRMTQSGRHIEEPSVTPLTKSIFSGMSEIDKISIRLLTVPQTTIAPIDKVNLPSEDQSKVLIGYGAYLNGDPTKSLISGGGFVSMTLSRRWSIDLGLGLGREYNRSDTNFEDVRIVNQLNAFGTLTSSNNYNLTSVFIPIRVISAYGRHHYFAGVNLKRPFTLNGHQEATLSSDVERDMGSPGAPGSPSTVSNDPLMAIRDYNLSNIPTLDRWMVYGHLGYGYQLTQKVQLNVAASYRFSQNDGISPLIRSTDNTVDQDKPWGVSLRLNYYFK